MSCPTKCATCPLLLAHDDPSWRFDDEAATRIRPATPADIDVIEHYILATSPETRRRRYHYQVSAEAAAAYRRKDFENCPPDNWHHLELVIELPCGAIGGVCHAYEERQLGYHEIGISVSDSLAGRGAARRLLSCMIAWAQNNPHVDALFASTEYDNESMNRLARSCGFDRVNDSLRNKFLLEAKDSAWLLDCRRRQAA